MHVGLRLGGILNVRPIVTQIPLSHSFTLYDTLVPRLSSAPSSIAPKVSRAFASQSLLLPKLPTYKDPTASQQTLTSPRNLSIIHKMESNGSIRNKRKKSPITNDRPMKQLKPETLDVIDSEGSPEDGPMQRIDSDGDESRLLPLAPATADTAEWQATIEKVVRNVVSIHFCQVAPFDTDSADSSEATGFVVDAEKGYILTNRYVGAEGFEVFG